MNARYSFRLESQQRTHPLPAKIIIGQSTTETTAHVLLKFLGFALFYRDRLQVEVNLHLDHIPYTPDLVQLDYTLQPKLWVECGECSVAKLDKLAVKVPEAEIWVVKRSPADANQLLQGMAHDDLRRNRYRILAFDPDMFHEMEGLLQERNQFVWIRGSFNPPLLQCEFNGLWFDSPLTLLHH